MEKILLAIDAINPDKHSIEFSCYLAHLTKSRITGVFLENLIGEEKPVTKQMHGLMYVDWEVENPSLKHSEKVKLIKKSIGLFVSVCTNHKVNFHIHKDVGVPLHELEAETRFADLLIIDAKTSFHTNDSNIHEEEVPTNFVKEILAKSECPVIISPEHSGKIEEIIFTYNNTASSVFAIKQFTYSLPQLRKRKATVLHVNETGTWKSKDKAKLDEWLREHYQQVRYETVQGEIDSVLFDRLFKRENIILVMGAYGRSALSRFLKPSNASLLLRTITQPVFIAHIG
jgi:hypothetical protein